MTILIIEDENQAAKRLISLVQKHFLGDAIMGNIDSVSAAVRWLNSNAVPDLVFCDIQLSDGICFEIFDQVKLSTPVIFTTAFDHYALRAFKVNAVDYLLKPIDPEDLAKAIGKFKANQLSNTLDMSLLKDLLQSKSESFKMRFLVRFGEKIQSIPIEDVAFFFSSEKMSFLQTHDGKKYILDYTMDQLEAQVDPRQFFRLNRQYLSRLNAIDGIYAYSNSRLKISLINCNDRDILVSREKVGEFKSWLDR